MTPAPMQGWKIVRVLYFTGETLLAPRELLTGSRHEGVLVPAYFTGCRSPVVEWRRLGRGIWGVGVKKSPNSVEATTPPPAINVRDRGTRGGGGFLNCLS
jgi:hypothetical protein